MLYVRSLLSFSVRLDYELSVLEIDESLIQSAVTLQLDRVRVLPLGLMSSRVLPTENLWENKNLRSRYITWNFGELTNEANNVDTLNDLILLEVRQSTCR